tara:strand:- start:885 stop:1277 length:393 start_codon:yes stop_codon:yes gene_type:complete
MARSPSNKGITNRNANVPPAGRNYQDQSQAVRRIPGVSFGEQQELTEQQKAAPLAKDSMPNEKPQPRQNRIPQMDIFSATKRPNEPVTSGLPFGPGVSPVPSQEQGLQDVKNFIYESWLATGDDSLLEFL